MTDKQSPYRGVYRVHLINGYVDVRSTRSRPDAAAIVEKAFSVSPVNGCSVALDVGAFRHFCRSNQVDIYDYGFDDGREQVEVEAALKYWDNHGYTEVRQQVAQALQEED